MWCCQPRGDPETRGEGAVLGRGCLHPEPALPGVSMSTPCKPGAGKPPASSACPLTYWGKASVLPTWWVGTPGSEPRGAGASPALCMGGETPARPSIRPSAALAGVSPADRGGRSSASWLRAGRGSRGRGGSGTFCSSHAAWALVTCRALSPGKQRRGCRASHGRSRGQTH